MKTFADSLHEMFVAKDIEATDENPDVGKWMEFLDHLPAPKDNIEKSYNKYLCRMYYFPAYKKVLLNAAGFFADIIAIAYILLSNRTVGKKRQGVLVLERSRAVPDFSDFVPEELYRKYSKVITVDNYNKKFGFLCRETRKIWFSAAKRYPFDFFFLYWVFMELAAHSYFLLKYNPEACAVYVNERNVVSPMLTELYESQGRKLISFMHGEYLLKLIQAHMKFSEYYVWDESYIEMFRDILRCDADFIVYRPKKLTKRWHLEDTVPDYFCTYYFGDETEKTIYRIAEIFTEFEKKGKKCKIRLHPRDIVHTELLNQVFRKANIEIEDNQTVTLEMSLARTKYAVGMQTTVLFEALAEGREIVIDDASDTEHFRHLQERRFRLLHSDHILLSDLMQRTQ